MSNIEYVFVWHSKLVICGVSHGFEYHSSSYSVRILYIRWNSWKDLLIIARKFTLYLSARNPFISCSNCHQYKNIKINSRDNLLGWVKIPSNVKYFALELLQAPYSKLNNIMGICSTARLCDNDWIMAGNCDQLLFSQ